MNRLWDTYEIRVGEAQASPFVVEGEDFSFLTNHNGTDVMRYPARWVKKQ